MDQRTMAVARKYWELAGVVHKLGKGGYVRANEGGQIRWSQPSSSHQRLTTVASGGGRGGPCSDVTARCSSARGSKQLRLSVHR
ncbi:hypothetical protein HaLaN_16875, partial [Haematococcus lacustris]